MNEVARDTAVPAGTSGAPSHAPASFFALTLGSVGIVYGDIGTSPLYAFREAAVAASASGPITREIVLGVLSMILWSLIVVVTIKYVLILLRADNKGEGGTLSLTALAFRAVGRRTPFVLMLGIIGAAMFLGDSVITPGDFGALRRGGPEDCDTEIRALRGAAHDGHPGRAVFRAAPRHCGCCGVFRPVNGGLVRLRRRDWTAAHQ